MKYYDVTCEINGKSVVIPIAESEILKAYGELLVNTIADKIFEYLQKEHPDAEELYGKEYRKTVYDIAHDILDYLETEGMETSEIDDEIIAGFISEHMFSQYKIVTEVLSDDMVVVVGYNTKNLQREKLAYVSKNGITKNTNADANRLDVMRAIEKAKQSIK